MDSGHDISKCKAQNAPPHEPPPPPKQNWLARAWGKAKRAACGVARAMAQAVRGNKTAQENKVKKKKKRRGQHTQGDMCGRRVWHNGKWVLAKNVAQRVREKQSKIKLRRKAGVDARVHVLYTQENSSTPALLSTQGK